MPGQERLAAADSIRRRPGRYASAGCRTLVLLALGLLIACGGTSTPPRATLSATPPATTIVRASTATPATPVAPAPGQAYQKLQSLDNYRLTLSLNGLTLPLPVANPPHSDNLLLQYDYAQGNRHVTVRSGSNTVYEAYDVGGMLYVRAPTGGFVKTSPASPNAGPVQSLFDLPKAILTALTPASANYTTAGTAIVDGRTTTRYTATVSLPGGGTLGPLLHVAEDSARVSIWSDQARGFLVAAEATFAGGQAIRLDVTDVGNVVPITAPS